MGNLVNSVDSVASSAHPLVRTDDPTTATVHVRAFLDEQLGVG